jgi:hypothetical protein
MKGALATCSQMLPRIASHGFALKLFFDIRGMYSIIEKGQHSRELS